VVQGVESGSAVLFRAAAEAALALRVMAPEIGAAVFLFVLVRELFLGNVFLFVCCCPCCSVESWTGVRFWDGAGELRNRGSFVFPLQRAHTQVVPQWGLLVRTLPAPLLHPDLLCCFCRHGLCLQQRAQVPMLSRNSRNRRWAC
jgi:hypothetical protein